MPQYGRRNDVSKLHIKGGGQGSANRGGPYNASRWRKRRRHHLMAHPLCEICEAEGRAVVADIVHHRQDHHGNVEVFWFGALQSLCREHHEKLHGRNHKVQIGIDGLPIKQEAPNAIDVEDFRSKRSR
jgi:5-methylcytosine-specific restriction protein A